MVKFLTTMRLQEFLKGFLLLRDAGNNCANIADITHEVVGKFLGNAFSGGRSH